MPATVVDPCARLGMAAVRHRRAVVIGWLVAVGAGLALLPHLLERTRIQSYQVRGSESEHAARLMSQGFPLLGNDLMVLVLRAERLTARDPDFRHAVQAVERALVRTTGVSAVVRLPVAGDLPPPAGTPAAAFAPLVGLYRDPANAYAIVGLVGDTHQMQDRLPALRDAAARAARDASGGQVAAYLVGMPALYHDQQRAGIDGLVVVELVAVPLAVVVLLLGLRSVRAAVLPVAVIVAAVVVTLGLFSVASSVVTFDALLLSVVTVVGLGVGIDYALFIVARYREELVRTGAPEYAAGRALATTGRTVLYSSLVVVVAATGLLTARWAFFQAFTVGMAVVVLVALAASLTLLPAVLAMLIRRVPAAGDRPGRWSPSPAATSGDGGWARWARHLMRHPWPYAVGATTVLLALAAPALSASFGVAIERELLAGTPTGTGLAVLERDGLAGAGAYTTVLVSRAPGSAAPPVAALVAALRAEPHVAAVTSVDNGRDLTLILVMPTVPPDSPLAVALVHRIRAHVVPAAAPFGHEVLVGGTAALVADIVDECATRTRWVVGLVLVQTFLLLMAALRSVLIPLKAIAMNLLATAATFGVLVLLFPRSVIWANLPVTVFVLLFAVATDYELFLVRRMREDYRVTGDNTHAVAAGLQRTARPIALAATVMAVVLASLLFSRAEGLRQFGAALATGVVLDVTVVRLVLVPALMQIVGRWNWWWPLAGAEPA